MTSIKGFKTMIKNSRRNALKAKGQLVSLTLLTTLVSLVLFFSTQVSSRIWIPYAQLKDTSIIQDMTIDLNPLDAVTREGTSSDGNIEAQQYWIEQLRKQNEHTELDFVWTRTEGREFSQQIWWENEYLLTTRVVNKTHYSQINNTINNSEEGITKLVIYEGENLLNPNSLNSVIVDPVFAKQHNLKLGDVIRFQKDSYGDQLLVNSCNNKDTPEEMFLTLDEISKFQNDINDVNSLYHKSFSTFNWYQIRGMGSSVDYATPIMSNAPVPNRETEGLFYVRPENMGMYEKQTNRLYHYEQAKDKLKVSSKVEWDSAYHIKFKNNPWNKYSRTAIETILNDQFKQLIKKEHTNRQYIYDVMNKEYRFASRITFIEQTLTFYNLAVMLIFIIVLSVGLYIIGLMTRKQIEKTRGQIGTLRALGYGKRTLIFNYVYTPLIASCFGGIFGFLIALGIQNPFTNLFARFFLMDFGKLTFDYIGFSIIILIALIFTTITFLIAYLIMKKNNALTLISANKVVKIRKWGMFLKKASAKRNFNARLRTALLIDASGKMSVIGIVVFIATMFITISIATPEVFSRNVEATFRGINYKQVINYNSPVYNNPYTFLKTFNSESSAEEKEASKKTGKETLYSTVEANTETNYEDRVTALPINEDGTYNVQLLAKRLYNNESTNEFWSPVIGKNLSLSNLRFTQGDVSSTVDFFKATSAFGTYDEGFIWKQLFAQSPELSTLNKGLMNVKIDDKTPELGLRDAAYNLQSLYKVLVDAPSLSVTNRYHQKESDFNFAKTNFQKVEEFNNSPEFKMRAAQDLYNGGAKNKEVSQSLLDFLKEGYNKDNVSSYISEFKLDNGKFLNIHAIKNTEEQLNENKNNDYYKVVNIDKLKEEELIKLVTDYLMWYATLFSHRGDQGIAQAAYTRPPNYVQQFFKKASLNNDSYTIGFNVVPFSHQLETLGTSLKVSDGKTKLEFYGVDQEVFDKKLIKLEDAKGNDLSAALLKSDNINNKVILNSSAAVKLGLKVGDKVDLDVLQNEMQVKDKNNKYHAAVPKKWKSNSKNKYGDNFSPFAELMPISLIKVSGPSYDGWDFNGLSFSVEDPGPFYSQVIKANIVNNEVKHKNEFTIIGISDGYGTPTGWIQNQEANRILKYDIYQEYAWTNWFTKQWGKEFTKVANLEQNSNSEHKALVSEPDWENWTKSGNISVEQNDGKKVWINAGYKNFIDAVNEENKSAIMINQIFENEFPVFNYKYSNSKNIGDFETSVGLWHPYGNFEPVSQNGNDKGVDGASEGAMMGVLPTQIQYDILTHLTEMIVMVLIFINAFIAVITFVIILLTTSLIISDNTRFIATLKVLGYNNAYIAKSILGMYMIVIASMFGVGFTIGWFTFVGVMKFVPTVLPIVFPIWLIFTVMAMIIGVYIIAITAGFNKINKTNATETLKDGDV